VSDLATAVAAASVWFALWHVARVGVFAVRHAGALRTMWARARSGEQHPAIQLAVLIIVLFIIATWRDAIPGGEQSLSDVKH